MMTVKDMFSKDRTVSLDNMFIGEDGKLDTHDLEHCYDLFESLLENPKCIEILTGIMGIGLLLDYDNYDLPSLLRKEVCNEIFARIIAVPDLLIKLKNT